MWVELGGLSAKSAAKNLLDADVQVPGFRRAEGSVEVLLHKYIPSVTIVGAIIIGLLASASDVTECLWVRNRYSSDGRHFGKLLQFTYQRAGRYEYA